MARERCNKLCTKASTGMYAHCDVLDAKAFLAELAR